MATSAQDSSSHAGLEGLKKYDTPWWKCLDSDEAREPWELDQDIPLHSARRDFDVQDLQQIGLYDVVRNLHRSDAPLSPQPALWLYDHDGLSGRSYNGVMSPEQLRQILSGFTRFNQPGEPDARIRRYHFPSPGKEMMGLLLYHATSVQMPYLRDFFLDHVRGFETMPRFTMGPAFNGTTDGLYSFHMPSYVLTSRKRGESCKDTRLNGEGPWRKSEDVSACPRDLGTGMTEIHEEETLHEVQYSFHAECYDNNWTAISMVDTYHYYYDKENHDLLGYYEDPSSNDGMDWDPITIGSTSADLCPEEPEAYFFEVLRCRMEQVAQQSESNLLRLKRRIPKYLDQSDDRISFRHCAQHTLLSAENLLKANRQDREWLYRTTKLCAKLTQGLTQIIDEWQGLTEQHPHLKLSEFPQGDGQLSNAARGRRATIRRLAHSVQSLRRVVRGLQDLESKSDSLHQQLKLHLGGLGDRDLVHQHRNASFVQILSPVALSAAVCQAQVITRGPQVVWFILLLVVFYSIIAFIHGKLSMVKAADYLAVSVRWGQGLLLHALSWCGYAQAILTELREWRGRLPGLASAADGEIRNRFEPSMGTALRGEAGTLHRALVVQQPVEMEELQLPRRAVVPQRLSPYESPGDALELHGV